MEIDTGYAVKRFFPNSAFPQVYFEAVANAFDAEASEISISITVRGGIEPDDLTITISDNGIGFTDERFERFRRLQEPHDQFHKGLGRLVYLQYFRSVAVTSLTADGQRRKFDFSRQFNGDSQTSQETVVNQRSTILTFSGFRKTRLQSYDHLRPLRIKELLIEHFLPLLHYKRTAEEDFSIKIALETDNEVEQHTIQPDEVLLTSADVPDFEKRITQDSELGVFGEIVTWYAIREGGPNSSILTAASIDGRTVALPIIPPGALPAGHAATFLFESTIFQGNSDSARQRLNLPSTLSQDQLMRILRDEVAAILSAALPQISERNTRVEKELEIRYPHLLGLFQTNVVGLINRDEVITEAQSKFFNKQRKILDAGGLHDDVSYLQSLELSSRTLTEYVLYREMIIDRLRRLSEADPEEKFHNLIVPRYKVFDGSLVCDAVYSNNAWILDDKFMSFRTILSEGRMKEIVQAITASEEAKDAEKRPDITMIFSGDPKKEDSVDVVVVEMKRRQEDVKEGIHAGTQLAQRAQHLVDHCPNIRWMWYFGIIEIDQELDRLLRTDGWQPLYSKGRVFYKDRKVEREVGDPVPAPTYLMSYDTVVEDASARNHAFLELLKAGLQQHAEVRRAV